MSQEAKGQQLNWASSNITGAELTKRGSQVDCWIKDFLTSGTPKVSFIKTPKPRNLETPCEGQGRGAEVPLKEALALDGYAKIRGDKFNTKPLVDKTVGGL